MNTASYYCFLATDVRVSGWRKAAGLSCGGRAVSFVADLPDDFGGRDFRKQQRGDDDGADEGLRAVEGQIAGRADKGQEGGYDPFSGQLQDLYAGYGGGADAEGDQF